MAVHVVDLDRHGAEGCGEEVERGDSQPINGTAVCGNSSSCTAPFGTPRKYRNADRNRRHHSPNLRNFRCHL